MAYRDGFNLPEGFLEQICEQGLDGIGDAIRVVVNAAVQDERRYFCNDGDPDDDFNDIVVRIIHERN